MGVERLFDDDPKPDDVVRSGQSNSTTFAAIAGVLTAITAGVPALIAALKTDEETTGTQAMVIIAGFGLVAVAMTSVARVVTTDSRLRVRATSGSLASPLKTRDVREQGAPELPVVSARSDTAADETSYLVAAGGSGPPKWVKQNGVVEWVGATSDGHSGDG